MTTDTLIPFEEAIDLVLDAVSPLEAEVVGLEAAVGRIVAQDVRAPKDVPAFPISAMDGYAIPEAVFKEIVEKGEARARVVGEVAAGAPWQGGELGGGEVLRIFTGGLVPPWAACIVMQEQASRKGDEVLLRGPVKPRAYIRDAGSDVKVGEEVIRAGTALTPPHIGLLVSLGFEEVSVRARPKVGILVTGNEIVQKGPLGAGQIRDSNGPTIGAAAVLCGARDVIRRTARDDMDALQEAVQEMMPLVDLLLCTGGVSVGDYDYLREAVESLGARRILWRVAQRPGKPLYAATLDKKLILGLPGNPASALATFLCYGWPVLRKMQGATPYRVRSRALMASPAKKAAGFTAMLRGRRFLQGPKVLAEITGPQESHQILPFARADCLILGPPDYEVLEPGLEVEVVPFPWAQSP